MSGIKIKSVEETLRMREVGRLVAEVLAEASREIKVGMTTENLDSFAEKLIRGKGAVPVFIGYRGYRHATCISINEQVVHGIPGKQAFKEGDIVSLDIGARMSGVCGDTAATFPVGAVPKKGEKLLRVGREALRSGIRQARAGKHVGDISAAIQAVAEKNGFSVVRDLYGHGVGVELHEDPLIPNFGRPGEGSCLKPGMVLAIEPMLNMGGWEIRTLDDGWTVETKDKSLSCHFEHSVLITEGEPEVLTKL
jgi:methionyl aminopeptidase